MRCLSLLLWLAPTPLAAQEQVEAQTGTPPERIDLLAEAAKTAQGPVYEDCSREQEAAAISGAIVVCRRLTDPAAQDYDKEKARTRYAERTMNKGDPRAPDVAGAGIFRGPATVGNLCIPGLQKCPPPPAYMIDFSTLPDAPPGSDADRIARGLAPRGGDASAAAAPAIGAARGEELGLPPAPAEPAAVSPSESASPTAEP